jgi:uncharacterized membrane protein YphA (DoxX/SURF4 family)
LHRTELNTFLICSLARCSVAFFASIKFLARQFLHYYCWTCIIVDGLQAGANLAAVLVLIPITTRCWSIVGLLEISVAGYISFRVSGFQGFCSWQNSYKQPGVYNLDWD